MAQDVFHEVFPEPGLHEVVLEARSLALLPVVPGGLHLYSLRPALLLLVYGNVLSDLILQPVIVDLLSYAHHRLVLSKVAQTSLFFL
jgi:hypothetical protein